MAETLSLAEAVQLARSDSPRATEVTRAVMVMRRGIARELLSAELSENELRSRLVNIASLTEWQVPWDPNDEDEELRNAVVAAWDVAAPPSASLLLATMALGPAHCFPQATRLILIPPWLRSAYAAYLLAFPAIFLRQGEAADYAAHCVATMSALHTAIFDDRLADALDLARVVRRMNCSMMYFNDLPLSSFYRHRARILEWLFLAGGDRLGWGGRLRGTSDSQPDVGILHNSLVPGTETFYLLAHLEGSKFFADTTTVYLLDGTETELTAVIRPLVKDLVQLPEDASAAVERIQSDDLDLMLVTNNVTHGTTQQMRIAAHRLARVQVAGGGSPVTTGLSSMDMFLSSEVNDPEPDAQSDYVERLIRLPGTAGYFAYSHDHDPQTLFRSRADFDIPADRILFFSAANYYKTTPEVLAAWSEILHRVPNSTLMLMPFNPNWGDRYPLGFFLRSLEKARSAFGLGAERIHLVSKVPTRADLHGIMSLADVYLDSFPFPGSCSLIDPLVVGLPVVAMDGYRFRTGLAAGILRTEGLGSAVCTDVGAYIERAVRLAVDAEFRGAERESIAVAATPALNCLRTAPFAREFADFCSEAIAGSASRTHDLLESDAQHLRGIVATLAEQALSEASPALQQLDVAGIAAQLLLPYLGGVASGSTFARIVEINAGAGAFSATFAKAGHRVDMVEPDPACGETLLALAERFPTLACYDGRQLAWPLSTNDARGRAELPGLGGPPASPSTSAAPPAVSLGQFLREKEGDVDIIRVGPSSAPLQAVLRGIAFAETRPSLILVPFELGALRAGALPDRTAIESLTSIGYCAAAFGYRAPGRNQLGYISPDFSGSVSGVSHGTAILYHRGDAFFLACLARMLEVYLPAPARPSFAALGVSVAPEGCSQS